ncbi:hypothetical protein PO909_022210, partial [Leuciscus waleckii]
QRAQFSSLLNTYNCFLKDTTHLQLAVYENEGKVTFEGILGISWGVKKPIQLQIQDEKPIFTNESSVKSPDPLSPLGNKSRGMTRWGEFDDLRIDELEEAESTKPETPNQGYIQYESKTLGSSRTVPIREESSYLTRTMSDASLVKMRVKSKKMVESQRNRNNRFSINGHFYNYKVCTLSTMTNIEARCK